MKRDISNIKRDLENKRNNDIIYKKDKIKKIFNEDPDLLEVLGGLPKRPLNQYMDPSNPTEEELILRQEINDYNNKITHEQIVPFLKLNGIQKEVLNFVMFDIDDYDVSTTNMAVKTQRLVVMCLVNEDSMDTEYDIVRTDLLSYIVKDLLCWSNALGMRIKCVNDFVDIIDMKYYCRTLKFEIESPNVNPKHMGVINRYDTFI
jgi:hypothetical protein